MARRAPWLFVLAMLVPAQPAFAQDAGRVVLVTVDGTTLSEWAAPDLPAFRAILSEGAVAVVPARTSCPCEDPIAGRRASYRALAILGERLLGDILRDAGIPATALGDASSLDSEDLSAASAITPRDGTIEVESGRRVPLAGPAVRTSREDLGAPDGRRTDLVALGPRLKAALEWARLIVVDFGDAERGDRALQGDFAGRRRWVRLALRDVDQFLGGLRASLAPNDVLIVASLAPPLEGVRRGEQLGAVAATGLGRGLLASETTRRAGLITIPDLAVTILSHIGAEVPDNARGRPAVLVRGDPARARTLQRNMVAAHRTRSEAVQTWMWILAGLVPLAFVLIVSGRGRRPGIERFPRLARDLVATGLLAVAFAPGAMLLSHTGWAAAAAILLALGARAGIGRDEAVLVAVALPGLVALADTLAGGPLGVRSAIGPDIASGVRVAGTSDAVLTTIAVTPLLVAGLLLDRGRHAGRVVLGAAAAVALGLVVAAAPTLGGRIAAPFAIVPAAGAFALTVRGRRAEPRALTAIAIATAFIGGLVAAAHLLRDPPSASIDLPVSTWVGVTLTSAWTAGAAAALLVAGLLLTRRRTLVARGLWGRPGRRASLAASAVASGVLLFASPTGMEAVATIAALSAPVFLVPFLAPD